MVTCHNSEKSPTRKIKISLYLHVDQSARFELRRLLYSTKNYNKLCSVFNWLLTIVVSILPAAYMHINIIAEIGYRSTIAY